MEYDPCRGRKPIPRDWVLIPVTLDVSFLAAQGIRPMRGLRGSGGIASLNHRLMNCDPSRAQNQSQGQWLALLAGSGGIASLNHRLMECDPSRAQNQSQATWYLFKLLNFKLR